jgi:hypothetical protein
MTIRLPPQDAYALRYEGLDAVTIGLFSKNYNAWAGIHTVKDTWKRIEMENAQKILNLALQY